MTIARDFTDPNKVVEYTQALNLIANTYGLLNEKGLFSNEFISQNTIQFESLGQAISVIPDMHRGTRHNVNKQPGGKMLTYSSTYHPLDDALYASELQGVRRFGTADQPDVESERIAKKLESIRRSHAATLETARWVTLTTGAQYAPNSTQSANFYTDFGIARVEKDLTLGTSTTEVNQVVQEGIAAIQDTMLTGEVINGFTVYCSPVFFAKLTKHAKVVSAFTYYSSTQEPLRQGFRSGKFQRFEYGGVTYIEVRGGYNGQLFIPSGDAYMVAEGTTDVFKTYFTPAARFDTVNTIAEEAYVWMWKNQSNTEITVQSESSFMNVLTRPQAVVRLFSSN
jgi:hypothetical protein